MPSTATGSPPKSGTPAGSPAAPRSRDIAQRRAELESSVGILGVTDLEMLGYPDSGMMGWPQNDAPGSFWSTPVDEAAAVLADLMRRYRPDVVVTYDENGFYGHPDHIQAHRITMAAIELTPVPSQLSRSTAPRGAPFVCTQELSRS